MAVAEQTTRIPVSARPSRWQKLRTAVGILARSWTAMVGLVLVSFWVVVALFADTCLVTPACWVGGAEYQATPLLARYSPLEQFRGASLQGPSSEHWLGTDRLGRDLWARLAHGARIILVLAPLAVGVALLIGGTLGLLAGYYGGLVDEIVMRVLDALMAFPQILLYLVIIAALGPSALNVVLAIMIAGAPGIARLVRSLTMDIKTRDYVAAAQTRGESPWYIMLWEILPNARGPLIVDACLRIGYTTILLGTLGYFGLGLAPESPDWGTAIKDASRLLRSFIHPAL